jgi:hypothetical protein
VRTILVALATACLAALTHYVAVALFLVGTCAVDDTATTVPAPASLQGLVCDRQDSWLNVVPYVLLASSLVAAVALAALLWRSARWRWVALTAWLWLPAAVWAVLALPPDSCTDDQRREHRAQDCRTVADG